MGIRNDLRDFLTQLPGVDDPDDRRAMVSSTRPTDMVIYLDFQGADIAFANRVVDELSRRGKAATLEFLGTLYGALNPGLEAQEKLDAFKAAVGALDDVQFRAEFPAPAPAGLPALPKPDAAILAGALVSDALVPYYALGAGALRQKIGERAAQAAEQIAEAVAEKPDVALRMEDLQEDPKDARAQARLVKSLKGSLDADPGLTAQLAALYDTVTTAARAEGQQTLLEVSQEAGVVQGSLTGAIVGDAALASLKGKIDVQQKVDTVGPGGAVVGAVVGAAGPINIGGQHTHGDQIDTGGGALVRGNLNVGRDFVGRDQVIHGDQVGGDKITASNVSGTGIGIGKNVQVSVQQGLSAAELAALFQTIDAQIDRRPEDPSITKDELRTTVQQVKEETAKGEQANPARVERLLKTLADWAPDVADVALATLANPAAGIASAVAKVAQRLKASRA
jgi:hypothetical protein